jgi:hypothetical protein
MVAEILGREAALFRNMVDEHVRPPLGQLADSLLIIAHAFLT